jgi:hypothetical protein
MKPKPDDSFRELRALSVTELNRRRSRIDQELANRANHPQMVTAEITINAGNRLEGAKCWIKKLSDIYPIDPRRGNISGIPGKFLASIKRRKKGDTRKFVIRCPEGTMLVAGGRGGSRGKTSAAYITLSVAKGAKLEYKSNYQSFSGTGVERVTQLHTRKHVLYMYPQLEAVSPEWFEVYAILQCCNAYDDL